MLRSTPPPKAGQSWVQHCACHFFIQDGERPLVRSDAPVGVKQMLPSSLLPFPQSNYCCTFRRGRRWTLTNMPEATCSLKGRKFFTGLEGKNYFPGWPLLHSDPVTSGSHLPSSPSPFSGSLQSAGMEPSSRTPPPPPLALLLQWSQHHGHVKSSKSALHLNFSGFPRGLTPEALLPLPCPSSRIPFSPLLPPALPLPAHSTPAPFNSSTFTRKHLQGHTQPLDTEPSASSLLS